MLSQSLKETGGVESNTFKHSVTLPRRVRQCCFQGPQRDDQETSGVEGDWEDIDEKDISEGSKNRSGSTIFETEKPGQTSEPVFSLQSRNKEP
ncbi:hypothetical protein HID58_074481 [Brassica napus]|uniref:Uncharacterized protein n=1 Tax=Brassica napus TaxID=3708 RepID=A0ABQ7YGZ4_BRANA|nr:hypothetical protein HID58_074481 [Brassica napus]